MGTTRQRRLGVLMIEPDAPGALSARKLLVESLRHNVFNAYSAEEGLELAAEHPMDVFLVHSQLSDMPPETVIDKIRQLRPDSVIVGLSASDNGLDGADHCVSTYDPERMVQLIRQIAEERDKVA